ncbi:hypothetical protein DL96DRAFT_1551064 [Flagelloscypha sp. PMI_526]|nr:hypothetical protein DL96DRAFT_1551064 [Flagelloscypha sp. PMI_526]
MFLSNTPTLSLAATGSTFPFQAKGISFSAPSSKVILGSGNPALGSESRTCSSLNGFFEGKDGAWARSLEWEHATIWIQALESKYGTYLNDALLKPNDKPKRLQDGDILCLGDHISPPPEGVSDKDVSLRPIHAKIGLLGMK